MKGGQIFPKAVIMAPPEPGLFQRKDMQMQASSFGLAGIFALAIGGAAYAQDQGPPPDASVPAMSFRQACGADAQTICPSAQTMKDKRVCLKANLDKASADCNTFLANNKAMRQDKMQDQMQGPPPGNGN
jgi:hypothetical protein